MFDGGLVALITPFTDEGKVDVCALGGPVDFHLDQGTNGLEKALKNLIEILMIETNPIPVKWSLFEMGLVGPHIRLPMTRLAVE
jgi:dihydrodipicolinate synthase/N-acetylneuraminate lyase